MGKVFVTGSTGVIGRRVVPRLLAEGQDVTAVVRSAEKAAEVRQQGAAGAEIDLFDRRAVSAAVAGHDVVVHLATHIPTGPSAAIKRGWRLNDRLRTEAADNLSRAAIDNGVERYIQESITFPYVDGGDDWIDERADRTYFSGNATSAAAEAAAATVAESGVVGVSMRFAMFMADDSRHMRAFGRLAQRGFWGLFGPDDHYISFIHVDDAADAVVAALTAGSGVYNIAESDPSRRGAHRASLAAAVGRSQLRAMPRSVERMGGAGAESLARSHRISSTAFRDATGWQSSRRPIDVWSDLV